MDEGQITKIKYKKDQGKKRYKKYKCHILKDDKAIKHIFYKNKF